ncbi:MAG: SLBB domain-containing protein [Bdellovibrionales bacterium]|nr:SLBB domain-containing protein [Bdellovibrionales bacterium]
MKSMQRVFEAISPVICLFLFSNCATKKVEEGPTHRSSAAYETVRRSLMKSDRISAGNTISIDYSADQKVSGTYKVDYDGRVQMPYNVNVKLSGYTTTEAKDIIAKAYKSYVKSAPTIRVEIKERSVWVEVRGEVKKSGRYLVRFDMPLEELITQAGGFLYEGEGAAASAGQRPEFLRIVRPSLDSDETSSGESTWFQLAEYFYQFDTEPDFLWRGGERLFFQTAAPADAKVKKRFQTVTVMGEVRDPKELPVLPGADLLTYISRAGGLNTGADVTSVEIVHRSGESRHTVNILKNQMMDQIKAGDVIIVRTIPPPETSAVMELVQIAQSVATVTLSVVAILML